MSTGFVTSSASGCDDALLLREMTHRTANEVASALAAMRLVSGAPDTSSRWSLVERAIERLEGFGELNRLLARPVPERIDVAAELGAMCVAAARSRPETQGGRLVLDLPPTWIDGRTGRRLVVIAAELVSNALKHALAGRGGRLELRLRCDGAEVVLKVRDDGPGIAPGCGTAGTGHGRGIVAELVSRAGGSLRVGTGPRGTTARVALPVTSWEDLDDVPF